MTIKYLFTTVILIIFASMFNPEALYAQRMSTEFYEEWEDYDYREGGGGGVRWDPNTDSYEMPDIIVDGHHDDNWNSLWDMYMDISNNINSSNYDKDGGEIGDVIVVATKPDGGGGGVVSNTSNTNNPNNSNKNTPYPPTIIDKKLEEINIECKERISQSHSLTKLVKNEVDLLFNAVSDTIGKNVYVSFRDYVSAVSNRPGIEHNSYLTDYGTDGSFISKPVTGTHNEAGIAIPTYNGAPNPSPRIIIHNHPSDGNPCVSAQDIKCLLGYRFGGTPNLNTIIAWDGSCLAYAATIVDPIKAEKFYKRIENAVDSNHNWKDTEIERILLRNKQDKYLASALAFERIDGEALNMQMVLDALDAGIVISRFTLTARSKESQEYTHFYTKKIGKNEFSLIFCFD